MTAAAISLSYSPATIDFTSTTTGVYGTHARANVAGAAWALFSSDADGSGTINAADRSTGWNDRNLTGYLDSDCNLDGTTNATDRSLIWNNRNVGGTLPE